MALSIAPVFNVVFILILFMLKLLYRPKYPPCSSILMFLFSCVDPMYPVYMPHVFFIVDVMLYSLPPSPSVIMSDFVFIGAGVLNFTLLLKCCHVAKILLSVGVTLSPPLRPSSLYSPYWDIVPYIGACPYMSGVFFIVVLCVFLL